jgi:hypothetical protein
MQFPFGNVDLLMGSSGGKPRQLPEVYADLKRRFGSVFSFFLGSIPIIVVTGQSRLISLTTLLFSVPAD